ncbi:MAG: hypothetical protein ACE5JH_10240 [Acidobacteriota bacterium]
MSRKWTSAAGESLLALSLVLASACSGEDDGFSVGPLTIAATASPATADPGVFLQVGSVSGGTALIDVTLQMSAPQSFDAFNLRVAFDPGLVQVAVVFPEAASTGDPVDPFGECGSDTTYCAKHACVDVMPADGSCDQPGTSGPFCLSNGSGDAAATGDLLVGVAADPTGLCDSYDQGGTVKLLTLAVTASTVGTSRLTLVSSGGVADCGLLSNTADLGVPCVGEVEITATR